MLFCFEVVTSMHIFKNYSIFGASFCVYNGKITRHHLLFFLIIFIGMSILIQWLQHLKIIFHFSTSIFLKTFIVIVNFVAKHNQPDTVSQIIREAKVIDQERDNSFSNMFSSTRKKIYNPKELEFLEKKKQLYFG